MPSGVFKPYAGVSTAVLVFVKGGKTEKVWFYDMESDGYSLDDKRDKNDKSDIPDIIINWNLREKAEGNDRKAKFFFVPVEEIKGNGYDLSINRYKEVVYEEIKYDSPDEIINGDEQEPGLRQLTEERIKLLKELETTMLELIKLKKVATIIMGQSPKGNTYNDRGIGLPLLNGAADYKV